MELARLSDRLKKSSCMIKLQLFILDRMKLVISKTIAGDTKLAQEDLQGVYQILGNILGQRNVSHEIRDSMMRELIEVQQIFLTDERQGVAERAIKALINLLRGFEQEVPSEVKITLGKLASNAINGVKHHPPLRDLVVQLFNKLVIVVGEELCPLLKQLMEIIMSQTSDPETLNAIIKFITLTVVTWKNTGILLAVQVFNFIFSFVVGLGFPADNISDINRSTIEVANSFIKLIKSLCAINPTIFFTFSLEQFKQLILYLSKWAYHNVDESLRRVTIELFTILFAAILGLKAKLDGINNIVLEIMQEETKENIRKLIVTNVEYKNYIEVFIEVVKVVAINPLEVLSPFNAIDLISLTSIAGLQFLLYRIVGLEFIEGIHIGSRVDIKNALEETERSGVIRNYREVLRKLLVAKKNTSNL